MNNETVLSVLSQAYINEIYLSNVAIYSIFAALAILTYASFLHFADEVEYIWKRKFTLATYLYFFAKYPLLLYLSTFLFEQLWPNPLSLGLCQGINISLLVLFILGFIGVQGLILLRTYSLCRGYRPVSIVLFTTFLAILCIDIYKSTAPVCVLQSLPDSSRRVGIASDIIVFFFDILAFIVVIWQVWGLWRLKRGLGLKSNQDLVTSVLRQGVLRFCFVLFISTTQLVVLFFSQDIADIFSFLQIVLSSLLMCELTLDLRRRNTPRSISNASSFDLPTISVQENPVQSVRSVFVQLHESIVAEMGERNHLVDITGLNSGESDDLQNLVQDT